MKAKDFYEQQKRAEALGFVNVDAMEECEQRMRGDASDKLDWLVHEMCNIKQRIIALQADSHPDIHRPGILSEDFQN